MKLLLVQPPIQDFYDTDIRLQPIGLASLKAVIRLHHPDVEVVIRDFHHGRGRRTVQVPAELAYLKDYYPVPDKSPFSTFHHYYHFGADYDSMIEEIAREKPDLVGISSLFSPYYREALKTAEAAKRACGAPILMGGSHVSAMPEFMLSHPAVDFVIRGEGERPIVEFLKAWKNSLGWAAVPSLGYKEEGRLIFNDQADNFPMEELPVPDLSDFNPEHYTFEKKPMCFVITSRSCPHRCTFCSVHKTFGFTYRRHKVERVIEEIRARYDAGYRVFDFEDDNLTFYKEEMKTLCRALIEAFPSGDVQFLAMNGISYLSLDEELLRLMRRAGFTHLNLALVTSDVAVRETTKRPHTVKKYLETVSLAAELGFRTVSYQILGLPSESLDSMIQTLAFAARLPVLLGASMFYLTPNSPIAKDFPEASERDVFLSRLTAMAVETSHFKREDIYTLFVTTRILNFLKGLSFPEEEITLGEALVLARRQDVRSAAGAEILQRILAGQGYHAWVDGRFILQPRFLEPVFRRVWSSVGRVGTQEGRSILLQTEIQSLSPADRADTFTYQENVS